MEKIVSIIALASILGIFVVACNYHFISENRKWMDIICELARLTGLEIQRNEANFYPNLVGNYFGNPAKLEIVTIDGSEGVLPSVSAHLSIYKKNHPNYSLAIERRNIFSRNQIKIGDPTFEKEYFITSQSEEFARELLASTITREKLIRAHFDQLSIKGEEFSMWIHGVDKRFNDLSSCLASLHFLTNLSENIDLGSSGNTICD